MFLILDPTMWRAVFLLNWSILAFITFILPAFLPSSSNRLMCPLFLISFFSQKNDMEKMCCLGTTQPASTLKGGRLQFAVQFPWCRLFRGRLGGRPRRLKHPILLMVVCLWRMGEAKYSSIYSVIGWSHSFTGYFYLLYHSICWYVLNDCCFDSF